MLILIEPPYTERYVRWCERSVGELITYLLLDYPKEPTAYRWWWEAVGFFDPQKEVSKDDQLKLNEGNWKRIEKHEKEI